MDAFMLTILNMGFEAAEPLLPEKSFILGVKQALENRNMTFDCMDDDANRTRFVWAFNNIDTIIKNNRVKLAIQKQSETSFVLTVMCCASDCPKVHAG